MATRVEDGNELPSDVRGGAELVDPAGATLPGKRYVRSLILLGILLVATIGAAIGYERGSRAHFFPGTRIGGVLVGSRTADEAAGVLHERYVLPLRQPMTLSAPDFEAVATPWEMGMRVDVDDVVREAFGAQRSEPMLARIVHRVFGTRTDIDIEPKVADDTFDDFLKATFKDINRDPRDARVEVEESIKVIPDRVGRKVHKNKAEDAIFAALTERDPTVEIPTKVTPAALTADAFDRLILVSTGVNQLKLYKNGKLDKVYGVATGTGGYPTPHGTFHITAKRRNPTWYNPNSDWSLNMPPFIGPGPGNPLGTRALNLSASGIRIHGTPDEWSIGSNASHGCIRMRMSEAEDLFERVEVGTPVMIVY